MSTAFGTYVGIIGAGYGADFEIDAADLMTLRPITFDNTADVITGSAHGVNLGADPLVRDAFEELATGGTVHTGEFQESVAAFDVAKKIDEISGADDDAAPLVDKPPVTLAITDAFADESSDESSDELSITGAFADVDSTYQVFDGGDNKTSTLAGVAAASTIEPFEEAAAASLIATVASEKVEETAVEAMTAVIPAVAAMPIGAGSLSDVSALVEIPDHDNIFPEDLSIAGAFGDV
jgi:hypothetical protein